MCDFRFVTFMGKNSKVLTEKSFDMTKKINSSEPFDLEIGKGIILNLRIKFQLAHDNI